MSVIGWCMRCDVAVKTERPQKRAFYRLGQFCYGLVCVRCAAVFDVSPRTGEPRQVRSDA